MKLTKNSEATEALYSLLAAEGIIEPDKEVPEVSVSVDESSKAALIRKEVDPKLLGDSLSAKVADQPRAQRPITCT